MKFSTFRRDALRYCALESTEKASPKKRRDPENIEEDVDPADHSKYPKAAENAEKASKYAHSHKAGDKGIGDAHHAAMTAHIEAQYHSPDQSKKNYHTAKAKRHALIAASHGGKFMERIGTKHVKDIKEDAPTMGVSVVAAQTADPGVSKFAQRGWVRAKGKKLARRLRQIKI